MNIIIELLFLVLVISVCNNTNLPPSLLGNETPQPKYKKLKHKAPYVWAAPDNIDLDTMPVPAYDPCKQGPAIPVDNNYSALRKQPAYTLLEETLHVKTVNTFSRRVYGKFVLAGPPQKTKGFQPATKDDTRRNIKYFSLDQGLPGTFVFSMLRDKVGRLWMGTDNGLSMYDGTSFYNYTVSEGLNSNFISALAEDEKGRIWIGTKGGGVNVFNGSGFTHYTTQEGLCNNDVNTILKDRSDNIWIATNAGICVYRVNGFITYTVKEGLIDNTVLSLAEDAQSHIWIGTSGGINRFDGKGFVRFADKKGISAGCITALCNDKQGILWIGSPDGLSAFDGKGFTHYSEDEGLINNNVRAIINNTNGSIWVATYEGVDLFNTQGFTHYTTKEGLSSNSVLSLLQDDHDQLWMGTMGGGANIIGDYGFSLYPSKEGSNYTVQGLKEDHEGKIWIGTNGGGVRVYDQGKFSVISSKEGLSSDAVSCITEDNRGKIWIGTFTNGASVYDGKGFTHYTTQQGLLSNKVNCLLKDNKGKVWIGTDEGISVFHDRKLANYTLAGGLYNNSVTSFFEDSKGKIWIGTFGGGVSVFDGKGFVRYTSSEGLSNNIITAFTEDNTGRIWIGTLGGGLCLFDGKGFTYFTTNEGICNNNISSLVKDSLDRVWAGTGKGLSRFSQNNDSLFTILNYKKRQGLTQLDFSGAVLYDNKGTLWWGTGDALTSYSPPGSADLSFPLTYVTEVDVMGLPVTWTRPRNIVSTIDSKIDTIWSTGKDTFYLAGQLPRDTGWMERSDVRYSGISEPYPLPENLSLPHDKNWLSFHFTGIRFKDVETLRYRYMLEGFEDKLNPVTELNEADYRNLPPGSYTFKVFGRCRNAVWSLASEFKFEIRKPWWRSTLAYFLYVLGSIVFVFVFVKWRTSKLVKSKRLLELTVAARTAQIQKQNEELERLSIVASETDNVILIMDPSGKVEWVNASFERITGTALKELTDLKGETIFDISHNPKIREIVRECISRKKSVSFESAGRTKDGASTWESSTLTPIFDAEGNLKKLIIIDTDITGTKKTEQILEQKNRDTLDSINYAKKIQEAILPRTLEILNVFPESFVLYKPRDIISGDFYWFSQTEDSIILAVADCTGHGVPGALMSMIGNSLLHKIVNDRKISKPSHILKTLDKEVIKALKQNEESQNQDGMDIAVIEISKTKKTGTFSGANRPIYLIRDNEIIEIKGNKFPVGSYLSQEKEFVNYEGLIRKGDTLYLFTDGYQDQFGGKEQKKFKTKNLKETLLSIQHHTMKEQKNILNTRMKEWKGELDQVDDILVIGIRF